MCDPPQSLVRKSPTPKNSFETIAHPPHPVIHYCFQLTSLLQQYLISLDIDDSFVQERKSKHISCCHDYCVNTIDTGAIIELDPMLVKARDVGFDLNGTTGNAASKVIIYRKV